MALLAVQYLVRDYAAWQSVFDAVEELRRDWGVLEESSHQLAGDPSTVLALFRFATVAQARGFLTNREFRAAMEHAGVEGVARVEIYA
ncbi:MAG TPA: hypothetical protein VKU87_12190 [Thermomicrobiaceae bacterium]|nr:hypothetical protein [Thermomicrobiaceae bacterium]